jgi:hypothetical protein
MLYNGIIGIDLLIALGVIIDLRINSIRTRAETFALGHAKLCVANFMEIHGKTTVLECQPLNEPVVGHEERWNLEH